MNWVVFLTVAFLITLVWTIKLYHASQRGEVDDWGSTVSFLISALVSFGFLIAAIVVAAYRLYH